MGYLIMVESQNSLKDFRMMFLHVQFLVLLLYKFCITYFTFCCVFLSMDFFMDINMFFVFKFLPTEGTFILSHFFMN